MGASDASHLGRSSSDASQLGGSSDGKVCMLRIGSFNAGIDQKMLKSKKAQQYVHKQEDIITACVQYAGLHTMKLCEVGSHRQGLPKAGIHAHDMNIFCHQP